ncbi:4Fe-4S binding protein [Shewanella avicenniae]|uniref:4Fe-4S binding protein n=1 Tax=Shewanella avicenniae TaxID=2814294 RepID=A0ABX7QT94_9GAMM|nr:4Fe-4S binding protein [Shewanella avicenniae]QSX33906.1 4Fe-4S binding protein [Shewanella avicenniae]
MTITESLTLMLALLYGASQLWWAGKHYGFVATLGSIAVALAIAASSTLLIATLVAAVGLSLVYWRKPAWITGEVRINQLRDGFQHLLFLALLLVALQYTINTLMLKAGMTPWLARPNVVDAFLPIAGGIELKGISAGIWDQNHPAAAVMLAVVLLTGLICKRAFCGWACPIGLVGDKLYRLRKRLIKEELMPPAWLDWPLRMVKYLLLAAFIYLVCFSMPTMAIPGYLNGNYHKIADVKMALFFITPGLVTLAAFALILLIVAWRRQGFCRYLCPYGAILGLLSFASPLKIRRNREHCLIESRGMKCDKCTRACPANIIVHTKTTVRSDECQACMRCVAACPKKQALGFGISSNRSISARSVMLLTLTLLFVLPFAAYLAGYWDSQTPEMIRMQLIQMVNRIGH